MPRKKRVRKSPSIKFEVAREYVGNIMTLIRDAFDSHNIEYDESDNGTEIAISYDGTDSCLDSLYDIIKTEIDVPENVLSCLVDFRPSPVSNRVFIRQKRK